MHINDASHKKQRKYTCFLFVCRISPNDVLCSWFEGILTFNAKKKKKKKKNKKKKKKKKKIIKMTKLSGTIPLMIGMNQSRNELVRKDTWETIQYYTKT
jgi:calcineurin-like phosphoesterase family protein